MITPILPNERTFSVISAAPMEMETNNENNNIDIYNIPNGKEFQEEISLLENISKDSYQYLKDYSSNFLSKNDKLMKGINIYRDKILSEYYQFNFNEQPSNKSNNLEKEKDFIKAIEKHISLMKRIHSLYSQMFNFIKQNIEILNKFLDKFIKYFNNIDDINNKDKPIEDFLLEEFKNIVDSCLFMKIDFENFDFEEALSKNEFDQNFKTFVSNKFKTKNFILNIICPKGEISDPNEQKKLKEKKEKDINLLYENKTNLIKLHMENVGNISTYTGDKIEYNRLKKLYIENSIMQNGNILKSINLEKLTIRLCPNFQIQLLENLPDKLKELHLDKNNFVNFELDNIFNVILSSKKNLLQNLEYISFIGNNLTKVDLSLLSPEIIFSGLKIMNFYKNKINKFIFNQENFPNIKIINCCKNNLNKSYLSQFNNIGSLESENIFLLEPELCQNYYNILKQRLKNNENNLYLTKYLNITYMPKIQSVKYFEDFNINKIIINNLKKLDLSFNGLNCDTFFKFINKNNVFINLHSLNLNGNELDEKFFEKLLKNKIFPKLQHLYLNSNKIGDIKIENNKDIDNKLVYIWKLIYLFIQNNICLTKLTITKNPISKYYSIAPEPNNDADKSNKYIKRENNIIIINCLFSLLVKIRDELLTKEEEKKNGRKSFNLRFDCRSNVNKNSENYSYSDRPILKK